MGATWSDERVGALLDAAEVCFDRLGIRRTTVEDIAVEAGVSRITVYRRIGTRDEIVRVTLLRVTDRFLGTIHRRLLRCPDLSAALIMLVVETVGGARRNDLRLLYASEFHRIAGHPIPNAADSLFGLFSTTVRELVAELPGELASGVSADDAGEWVLRSILSLLSIPPTNDGWPSTVETILVPGLVATTPRPQ